MFHLSHLQTLFELFHGEALIEQHLFGLQGFQHIAASKQRLGTQRVPCDKKVACAQKAEVGFERGRPDV